MKYNQPFNADDPEAVYVDGNPATGTEGSVPRASSIEYPQREIVHVIKYAHDQGFVDNTNTPCAEPTNADNEQLRKAIFGMIRSCLPGAVDTDTDLSFYILTADTHRYVDDGIGSDTLYDGLAATIGSGHGPYKTIGRAVQDIGNVNLNGHWFRIHVANGTYTIDDTLYLPESLGFGYMQIIGNSSTPASCVVTSLGGSTFMTAGGLWYLEGLKIIANGNGNAQDPNPHCVWIMEGLVTATNIEWGTAKGAHVVTASGWFQPKSNEYISGSAQYHFNIGQFGCIGFYAPNKAALTILNAVSFSGAFVDVRLGGVLDGGGGAPYASITGAGNVTGKKYNCTTNGIIGTGGQGASYFPGSISGTTSTGGQYS